MAISFKFKIVCPFFGQKCTFVHSLSVYDRFWLIQAHKFSCEFSSPANTLTFLLIWASVVGEWGRTLKNTKYPGRQSLVSFSHLLDGKLLNPQRKPGDGLIYFTLCLFWSLFAIIIAKSPSGGIFYFILCEHVIHTRARLVLICSGFHLTPCQDQTLLLSVAVKPKL